MEGNRKKQTQTPKFGSGESSGSGGRNRHSGSGRAVRKIMKQRIIIMALSGVLVVVVIGWMFTGARLSAVKTEFGEYRLKNRSMAAERTENNREVEQMRLEHAAFVKGRIPGLKLLDFDKTIEIGKSYVRNIAFTLTGTADKSNYEYRVVLHNDTLNNVNPEVTIFLFDARGIQVGVSKLSNRQATSDAESELLQPNETRAYADRFELNLPGEPLYFLVHVE